MQNDSNAPPPPIAVLQMLMGMWVSQILGALAKLSVPDAIASGATSVTDIAKKTSCSDVALHRFLRAAATAGLLAETSPGHFANTPLGECLRSDAPGSLRDFIIAETAPGHWLPWGQLANAVKEGRSLSSEILGIPVWEYYAKNHEEGLSFA